MAETNLYIGQEEAFTNVNSLTFSWKDLHGKLVRLYHNSDHIKLHDERTGKTFVVSLKDLLDIND